MEKLMKRTLKVLFVFLIMAVFIPTSVKAMEGDNIYVENPGYQSITTTGADIDLDLDIEAIMAEIEGIMDDIEPISDEIDRSQYARNAEPISDDLDDNNNMLLIVVGSLALVAVICGFVVFKKKQ